MAERLKRSGLQARAFTIPTDAPGSPGDRLHRCGRSAAALVDGKLAAVVAGRDAMDPPGAAHAMAHAMVHAVRNLGRAGLCATAISAVDTALWDLKAKLLGGPLALLLGRHRGAVPIYGSGGFTSYDDATLPRQLAEWVERDGCRWVKMKIGAAPDRDPARVRAAKAATGGATLFVDANGAYTAKQAQHLAAMFAAEADLRWFEEPVSSDDLHGLRRVREGVPAPMEVAAGEYGCDPDYFARMLTAGAVDVLQADATRCGGVTGFLHAASLCEAFHTDLGPLRARLAPASRLRRILLPPCRMVP